MRRVPPPSLRPPRAFRAPEPRSDPGGPAGVSGRSLDVVATAATARTGLTRKSRRGAFSTGRMDAATKAASRLERPKNRGRTSAAFSGVMTFASSMTDDKHSRPSPSAAWICGVLLDQLRRSLPVLRRAGREPELPPEEREEAGVPELHPPPLAVEDREGDEELRERVVLAAEEVGEAGGLFAGGRHARRVACVLEASWNARIPVLARDPERPSRTPRASRDDHGAAGGARWEASGGDVRNGSAASPETRQLPSWGAAITYSERRRSRRRSRPSA